MQDGPSQRAKIRGTATLPPSAKDTVQVTISERINRTIVFDSDDSSFLGGRKDDDRESPLEGLDLDLVGEPRGGRAGGPSPLAEIALFIGV